VPISHNSERLVTKLMHDNIKIKNDGSISVRLPASLVKNIQSGDLIPFVGAGVSKSVLAREDHSPLFPDWPQLLLLAADRLDAEMRPQHADKVRSLLSAKTLDYLSAAKHAREGLGALWTDFLKGAVDRPRTAVLDESLELARAIWDLGSPLVITTNYDRVLRWTCPAQDDLREVNIEAPDAQVEFLQKRVSRPTVWYLHGYLDQVADIILTPDKYNLLYPSAQAEERYRAALLTLRSLLSSRPFLFVGFSLNDPYLVAQIKWVNDTYKGASVQHYTLVRERDLSAAEEMLGDLPVRPVGFEDFGDPLVERVRSLSSYRPPVVVGATSHDFIVKPAPARELTVEPEAVQVTAQVGQHHYPLVNSYLPRRVCETKNAGSIMLHIKSEELTFDLSKVVEREKRVVLLCDAGTGKTTELRRIASQYSRDDARLHAVFIPLNKYVNQSVPDLLCEHWGQVAEEDMLVILDGFDEIESKNRHDAVRRIESFAEEHPGTRILISCRTNFYATEKEKSPGTLTGFSSYTLLDLDERSIAGYVAARLVTRKKSFDEQVEANQLYDLLKIPFYLTQLVDFYEAGGTLPKTKAELFERLVQRRIDFDVEHYRTAADLRDKRRTIIQTLERLALGMESLGRNYISDDEFAELIPGNMERELIRLCTLLVRGEREGVVTWQFEHNNFQEHLAAKVLSRQDLELIKSFVSFEPSHKKIIPSWVNTLSFLVSIVDHQSSLFASLVDWLMEVEPELAVKFEPDKFDAATRTTLFERIFNLYKERRVVVDRDKFQYRELARFGQSNETVEFLLNEIEHPAHMAALASAVRLLGYCKLPYGKRRRAVDLLVEYAIGTGGDQYIQHSALVALANLELFTEDVLDRIVPALRSSDNDWVRSGMYYLLNESSQPDEYVDVYLEGLAYIPAMGRLGDESWHLTEGLNKMTSPQALKKIIGHFKEHVRDWERSSLEKVLRSVVDKSAAAYSSDESIYYEILTTLVILVGGHHDEEKDLILDFFTMTGTRFRAFRELFDLRKKADKVMTVLAALADKDCLTFFAERYVDRDLTNEDIREFQSALGWQNRELYLPFNKIMTEIAGDRFALPAARDYAGERRERRRHDFNLLFDRETFISEVQQLFAYLDKETATKDDIFNLYKKREEDNDISGLALQTVRELAEGQGGSVSISTTEDILLKNWEGFSISRIYQYLVNDDAQSPDLALTDEQREWVTAWCYSHVREVDFRKAITTNPDGTFNVSRYATYLWYFMQKLRLQYPEDVLLDMLSFEGFVSSSAQGIEYLEERLNETEMTERVLENLREGISNSYVLKNHYEYCKRHRVEEARPFALKEVAGGGDPFVRQVALEVVLLFPDAQKYLEDLLPSVKDAFKWKVVEYLVKEGSKICFDFLRNLLENGDENEKLRASEYLIGMQDMDGLRHYMNYVEENRTYPIGSRESSPLNALRTAESIPLLLNLLGLSYRNDLQQHEFYRLDGAVLGALTNVALVSEQNYREVRDAVGGFIEGRKSTDERVNYLYQFLDNLERMYYTNKSQDVTLQNVLMNLARLDWSATAQK
jgi:predicted NACHT family NTPase